LLLSDSHTKMAGRLPSSRMPGPRSQCRSHPSPSGGLTIILPPPVSPFTKYPTTINQVTPYNYPVPVQDDGNMADMLSHSQDPRGPSLEWLKKP
uniref:NADH dehydrogenase [ubiquinone] 1 alpha subcomplex subunit 3 n=1 Tax=Rhinolophus ferrumequinum TaxID=59479 RepID=A0A671E5I4_RHIFE